MVIPTLTQDRRVTAVQIRIARRHLRRRRPPTHTDRNLTGVDGVVLLRTTRTIPTARHPHLPEATDLQLTQEAQETTRRAARDRLVTVAACRPRRAAIYGLAARQPVTTPVTIRLRAAVAAAVFMAVTGEALRRTAQAWEALRRTALSKVPTVGDHRTAAVTAEAVDTVGAEATTRTLAVTH